MKKLLAIGFCFFMIVGTRAAAQAECAAGSHFCENCCLDTGVPCSPTACSSTLVIKMPGTVHVFATGAVFSCGSEALTPAPNASAWFTCGSSEELYSEAAAKQPLHPATAGTFYSIPKATLFSCEGGVTPELLGNSSYVCPELPSPAK